MKIHLPHVSVQFRGEIARTKGEFIKAPAGGNNDEDGDTGTRLHARQAESEYHFTPSHLSSATHFARTRPYVILGRVYSALLQHQSSILHRMYSAKI